MSSSSSSKSIAEMDADHAIRNNLVSASVCTVLFFGIWYMFPNSIPYSDLVFAIVYPIYLFVANMYVFDSNRLAFDSNTTNNNYRWTTLGNGRYRGDPSFEMYMFVYAVTTVILPLIWILVGIFVLKQPITTIETAVPPFLLLIEQIAFEGMTSKCHDVIRILVPIGFNTYRLRSLFEWVRVSYEEMSLVFLTSGDTSRIIQIYFALGYGFAVISTILWLYNLFIFLLLRVLPEYFDTQKFPRPTLENRKLEWKFFLLPVLLQHSRTMKKET